MVEQSGESFLLPFRCCLPGYLPPTFTTNTGTPPAARRNWTR